MAKKFLCPPQKATADNTFSDNLVGFQLVAGGGLTQGNFEFTTSITEKSDRDFIIGTFSDPITLDSLGVASIEESKAIVEKNFQVFPNFDLSEVTNFSQYGSLSKRVSVSLTKIINFFPASIESTFQKKDYTTGATATNIFFDSVNNSTTFTLDLSKISNPFSIDFTTNAARNIAVSEIELSPLRNMVDSATKYALYTNDESYNLLKLVPTTKLTTGNLVITVVGNPFSGQSISYDDLYIKPNNENTEKVFNQDFDEVEKFLLNRLITPIYTAKFSIIRERDNGTFYLASESATWPKDGLWNIDIRTPSFNTYVNKLSSLTEDFDQFKTNLIVRFLTTGAFKDFDTDDQKITKLLQIYGRSFDQVKKFIDALAYMNSVNYNVGNDIPSQLLKNLAQTLGWSDNISPITNSNFLDSVFGTTEPSQFLGLSRSYTPDELNYQFYRNLILNSAYLFKSKGTRKSIEGLLKLIGAPDALIEFNETIYVADQKINMSQFNQEFASITGGTYNQELPAYDPEVLFKIQGREFTGFTITANIEDSNITRDEYPVDDNGYPRAPEDTESFYFQLGEGWFESTVQHRSDEIFDITNSTFTGQNPNIQTVLRDFSYGQRYLDRFRDFPYSDLGFTLAKLKDNKKSWPSSQTGLRRNTDGNNSFYFVDDENLILNVKNTEVYLNPGQALTYDAWFLSSNYDYPIPSTGYTVGGNCYCPTYLNPTILDKTLIDPNPVQKTFFEFAQTFWQNMINVRDRQFITNGKTGGYPTLESVYWKYLKSVDLQNIPDSLFTYQKMIDYVQGLGSYWIRLIEQMMPATTIWNTGVKYENSAFHRQEFVWRRQRGCQIVPVPCNPCTLIGPILTYDCPEANTVCDIYPWTSNPSIGSNFGSVLNNVVNNNTIGSNCDFNTINTDWYVNISLGGTVIINEKFFDGVGIGLPEGISYPSQSQWLIALQTQLDSLIIYGLDYIISGNQVTVFTTTCDGTNLNSQFKINVGINFTISCS
jgi:hypothetical protein